MAGMRLHRRLVLSLLCTIVLAGCSNDMSDLRRYVEKTKQRPGGKVEPLPEFEPYESFTYKPSELRNPFVPQAGFALSEEEMERRERSSELAPDRDRRKEPLEQFPLDSLEMVGTLSRDRQQWGLVRDPNGTIHQVLEGNHMGQNYGQIKTVEPDKIQLVEIVPDGQGGWMEREAALGLSDE